jgi:hypothetical protein
MDLTSIGLSSRAVPRYLASMRRAKNWFGAVLILLPVAFVACGDDGDDGGGDGDGSDDGGTSGSSTGGSNGGSTTGGKGGSSGERGGTSGTAGTGGSAGEGGDGGEGGDDGGAGGDGGEAGTTPQGGVAGMGGSIAGGGAGGKAGGGAGGATAGGGAGGKAGGGAGGSIAGGGAGGATAGGGTGGATAGGGAGGATAGGGAGGAAAGMGGSGGVAPTCDPLSPEIYVGVLSAAQEVPPVTSSATGNVVVEVNSAGTEILSSIYWTGLASPTTNAHIHSPAPAGMNASPLFFYEPPLGMSFGQVVAKAFAINATQLADLRNGLMYANVHSATSMTGEIRAQLVRATVVRSGTLSAAQETTAVTSSATGRSFVAIFPGNTQAVVSMSWSGLTSNNTAWHVHGPAAAGFNAAPAFPVPTIVPPAGMSGSVVHAIWGLGAGHFEMVRDVLSYANVHSANNSAGEIRAQLLPACP